METNQEEKNKFEFEELYPIPIAEFGKDLINQFVRLIPIDSDLDNKEVQMQLRSSLNVVRKIIMDSHGIDICNHESNKKGLLDTL